MTIKNKITELLDIEFPVIMAPMFLVSNGEMLKSALKSGIAGVFPSLNYRKEDELKKMLKELNEYKKYHPKGTYGVNLIVQKTNPLYPIHLKICVEAKVPFYITSLGNPKEVIEQAHGYGAKVFCDVTNLEHAEKCASLGCDGFIAVGQGAGGHAGSYPLQVLVPSLNKKFPAIPIIAAGGIADGAGILSIISLGAEAVSMGTRFIASTEAIVSKEYKNAIVNSGMHDIVLTTRISGTPCTIINNPYAKTIGYTQNWIERMLSSSTIFKKYLKMLVQLKGMHQLEKSIKPGSYETLWCAGQSVELIHDILSCEEIITRLKAEFTLAYIELQQRLS